MRSNEITTNEVVNLCRGTGIIFVHQKGEMKCNQLATLGVRSKHVGDISDLAWIPRNRPLLIEPKAIDLLLGKIDPKGDDKMNEVVARARLLAGALKCFKEHNSAMYDLQSKKKGLLERLGWWLVKRTSKVQPIDLAIVLPK